MFTKLCFSTDGQLTVTPRPQTCPCVHPSAALLSTTVQEDRMQGKPSSEPALQGTCLLNVGAPPLTLCACSDRAQPLDSSVLSKGSFPVLRSYSSLVPHGCKERKSVTVSRRPALQHTGHSRERWPGQHLALAHQ